MKEESEVAVLGKPKIPKAKRFFSNPVVGIVGSLASVVGVLLAVYFYNKLRNILY